MTRPSMTPLCGSRRVQFGWVAQPSLVNGVAARSLAVPSLVVINASDYTHYVPDDEPARITEQAIIQFLDDILAGNVQVGGAGAAGRDGVAGKGRGLMYPDVPLMYRAVYLMYQVYRVPDVPGGVPDYC